MSARKVDRLALVAYLEDEITPSEQARIEAHLRDSTEARRELLQLQDIRDALSGAIPELESIDLAPAVRRAARAPYAPPAPRRWASPMALAGLAACAAIVLWVALPERAPEFRARSVSLQPRREQWAGIQVYRVGPHNDPQRLGDHLAQSDGLLFSYTNLGAHPFAYLMIFSIDARGAVRWYHPAYEREGTDPSSIPIERGAAQAPLAEVIHQDLAPGPLRIGALFSARPLHVLEVEAFVQERHGDLSDLPWPDAALETIPVEVVSRSP